MTDFVHICEVGPRDGLQNEAKTLGTDDKLELISMIAAAGVKTIEIGSFVNPKSVPTMADTDAVAIAARRQLGPDITTLGLIVNERGFDRALAAGVTGVCIVTVVSKTLCARNNRMTPDEATAMAVKLVQRAKAAGLKTRVDIATAWVCPYEGVIDREQVRQHADLIWEHQPDEMAFCDSIGFADPLSVARLFTEFGERYDRSRLVAHFHDTQALGLANATAALMTGVRRFDASLGGLGGCPFAPGARGNLATEDLVHLCHAAGLTTGINLNQLLEAIRHLEGVMERPLTGQSRRWLDLGMPGKKQEGDGNGQING